MSQPASGGPISQPASGGPISQLRGGPQVLPRPPGSRPGPPLPWPRLSVITVEDVVRAVAQPPGTDVADSVDGNRSFPPGMADGGPVRPSAVLCAVFEERGQAQVILTRRSARLRSHTGQVAFPGGRMDAGESPAQAAIREAWEEVDLDPALVTPVGELAQLSTAINPAPITPVVATLSERPHLVANPAEVDRVFTVPLVELLQEGVYRSELWSWPGRQELIIHVFELVGDTVWGATARMLGDLLDRLALVVAASY